MVSQGTFEKADFVIMRTRLRAWSAGNDRDKGGLEMVDKKVDEM